MGHDSVELVSCFVRVNGPKNQSQQTPKLPTVETVLANADTSRMAGAFCTTCIAKCKQARPVACEIDNNVIEVYRTSSSIMDFMLVLGSAHCAALFLLTFRHQNLDFPVHRRLGTKKSYFDE